MGPSAPADWDRKPCRGKSWDLAGDLGQLSEEQYAPLFKDAACKLESIWLLYRSTGNDSEMSQEWSIDIIMQIHIIWKRVQLYQYVQYLDFPSCQVQQIP